MIALSKRLLELNIVHNVLDITDTRNNIALIGNSTLILMSIDCCEENIH